MRSSFKTPSGGRSLARLTFDQRLAVLREEGVIDADDLALLEGQNLRQWGASLSGSIESAIGAVPVPLGLATRFVINDVPRLIVMATEERSVVAAAAKGAKLARSGIARTGIAVAIEERVRRSRAQILFADLADPRQVHDLIASRSSAFLARLKERLNGMDKYGGGLRAITPKLLRTPGGMTILVIDLDIDTGEAMGANVVTKMAEAAAAYLRPVTGSRHTAAICSNRDAGIKVLAQAAWHPEDVPSATLDRILKIHAWAMADPDRATTHNKGIMNAVTAIALATGQDTRAIEACCHSQACETGSYQPLSQFGMSDGVLAGSLALSLPVGTVGGATNHPVAALSRKIMGIEDSDDLACVMAAAGLAQNFGALRALADEGIPESHRRLSRK